MMNETIIKKIDKDLELIINKYNLTLEDLFKEKNPGLIRSKKGELVESLAEDLVKLTWTKVLNQPASRLRINNDKFDIKVFRPDEYVNRVANIPVTSMSQFIYRFSTDRHVFIDGKPVMSIECKAYTEIAMFKRIMVDALLMNEKYPGVNHYLLQLEQAFSIEQYHVIQSHFKQNVTVVTLLDGIRSGAKPIHKRAHKKELKKSKLITAIDCFEVALKEKA